MGPSEWADGGICMFFIESKSCLSAYVCCFGVALVLALAGCGGGGGGGTAAPTSAASATAVNAGQVAPSVNTPATGYTLCATEMQRCVFSGTASVIYGAGSSWTAARNFTDGVECNSSVFGDPVSSVIKACYLLAATSTSPITPVVPVGSTAFAVPADELALATQALNGTAHEALAEGVPLGFDWAKTSRLGQGNTVPAGFGALIGWGQVFWQASITSHTQAVEFRAIETYLCSGAAREWSRVQKGSVAGAAFWPDFANNEAVPASVTPLADDQVRVSFPADRAFHFWPRQGRVALSSTQLCGVLVLFQARAVAADGSALVSGATPQLLVGAGADYWTTTTADWDNYKTNKDVGIGQLRHLTSAWRWYGLNTAGAADLQRLQQTGFVERLTR